MKRSLSLRVLPFAYLLLMGLQMGCGGDDGGDDGMDNSMDAGAQDAGRDASMDATVDATVKIDAGNKFSDGQIFAVLNAYNAAQLQVSPPAMATSTNAAVDAYITAVLAERTTANNRAMTLLAASGVEPLRTPTSSAISEQGLNAFTKVSAASAATVDRVFLDWQVQLLQSVLGTIDTILLPSATAGSALHTELGFVRAEVSGRLAEARALRGSLDDAGVPFDGGI